MASVCLRLRSSSQGSGIEPHIKLPAQQGVCFSLSHCPSLIPALVLSFTPSLSNKIFIFVKKKKKKFIYLLMRDTEKGRDTGRGRSRLPAVRLTRNWIPGPWNQALNQRQMLNH